MPILHLWRHSGETVIWKGNSADMSVAARAEARPGKYVRLGPFSLEVNSGVTRVFRQRTRHCFTSILLTHLLAGYMEAAHNQLPQLQVTHRVRIAPNGLPFHRLQHNKLFNIMLGGLGMGPEAEASHRQLLCSRPSLPCTLRLPSQAVTGWPKPVSNDAFREGQL